MNNNHKIKGVVYIIFAGVVFSLMGCLIKCASAIDPYVVTFARFAIGLAMLGTAGLLGTIKLQFVSYRFLFLRGLVGGIATYIFFLSIYTLGVAKAGVICYSFPIFACIFSYLFLGEKIGLKKGSAIVIAFLGIYLLSTHDISDGALFASFGKYEIIAVCGAILGGIAITLVKKLHDTDSSYAIYLSQCAIGFWLLIIPANAVAVDMGIRGAFLVLCIGILGTAAQLLMTQGYKYVPVSTGASLMMLVPVLSFIVGIAAFDESLSVQSFVGSAVVLSCCVVVISTKN